MQKVCECRTVYAVDLPTCPQCGSVKAELDHPTVVGEHGPELTDLPAGSEVKPKK